MEPDNLKHESWTQTPFYLVAWLVSLVLMAIDLMLLREVVSGILTAIGLAKATAHPETWAAVRLDYGWTSEVVNHITLIVLACIGIALTIAIEYYYRKGIPQGLLVKRVTRIFTIELVVGIVTWIVTVLIKWLLARATV